MRGNIKVLWENQYRAQRKEIIGERFVNKTNLIQFVANNLTGGSANQQFSQGQIWNAATFQALYILCWIYHPTEKGTYMIDATHHLLHLRKGFENLKGRKSSHLSGKGKSASPGWSFLKGYHELLVQLETGAGNTSHLMLKCEGHTTGITGVVPHIKSYLYKRKHSKGLTANQALNNMANNPNSAAFIEGRAAENYGIGYKKLVKGLKLKGRQNNVRQVCKALFEHIGEQNLNLNGMNNQVLSVEIEQRINHPIYKQRIVALAGGEATVIKDLKGMVKTLRTAESADFQIEQVFREVRPTIINLDSAYATFKQ